MIFYSVLYHMDLHTVFMKSEQESEEKHIVNMFLKDKIYEYETKYRN